MTDEQDYGIQFNEIRKKCNKELWQSGAHPACASTTGKVNLADLLRTHHGSAVERGIGSVMRAAMGEMNLSPRGYHQVPKLRRTMAALAGWQERHNSRF